MSGKIIIPGGNPTNNIDWFSYDKVMDDCESQLLTKCFLKCGGCTAKTARFLKKNRGTIHRLLIKHKLIKQGGGYTDKYMDLYREYLNEQSQKITGNQQ